MTSPFAEVTQAERTEIADRLYSAQRHFEDNRNQKLYDKAHRLHEKFGGLQERVTRTELNATNMFLSEHGFSPTLASAPEQATAEQKTDWIDVTDALPDFPDKELLVAVRVKLREWENTKEVDAYYVHEQNGLNPIKSPCFALIEPVDDHLHLDATPLQVTMVEPSHWRPRNT